MSSKLVSNTKPVDMVAYGDLLSKQVIVYVHGFGVKYDSKGLFSGLANILASKGHRSVLFDLTDYDEDDNIHLVPLGQQVDRLSRVVSQIREPDLDLVILAHSLGCLVTAHYLLNHQPNAARVFLLDPATHNQIGPSMKAGYRRRPNVKPTTAGLEMTRDSGRLTSIGHDYFHDLSFETADLYHRLVGVYKDHLTVVWAGEGKHSLQKRVNFDGAEELVVDGADHNFNDCHQALADLLANRLKS